MPVMVAQSVDNVPIRLTPERWTHIVESRDELAGMMGDVMGVVESPNWVTRGYRNAKVAWKGYGRKRYLAVVYKEIGRRDGFVVTAFFTTKPKRKQQLWP